MRAAVIDLGSNSCRVLVYDRHEEGHLEVIEEVQRRLQLVREIRATGELSHEAVERVLSAVGTFDAVARAAGADRIEIIGTAALREASNASELIALIDERLGLRLHVVSGEDEARFAFVGAVTGLPVESGLVVDIGGGSVEIAVFEERALRETWTLPLGALRMADQWLVSDPPTDDERAGLQKHIRKALTAAGIRTPVDSIVGTGGAIRNLAKIDRKRRRYPVVRLHGYELRTRRLRRLTRSLSSLTTDARRRVPGLNPLRADSIVAAAICLEEVMRLTKGTSITVSGQGLREGIGRATLGGALPGAQQVRRASVRTVARRFSRWNEERAMHRAATATQLLEPADPPEELREALSHAAALLSLGTAVDPYNTAQRTAEIVTVTDLLGFSHRMLALVHAILRAYDRPDYAAKAMSPLLNEEDQVPVTRAAAALAMADDLHQRLPSDEQPSVSFTPSADGVPKGIVRIEAGRGAAYYSPHVLERYEQALGLAIVIEVT